MSVPHGPQQSGHQSLMSADELVEEIITVLCTPDAEKTWFDTDVSRTELRTALSGITDTQFLADIIYLASLIQPKEYSDARIYLRGAITTANHDAISAAIAHRDIAARNPEGIPVILAFHTALVREMACEGIQNSDGSIRNMDAHIYAFSYIRDNDYGRFSHLHFSEDYFANAEFLRMVDRHAAHVSALLTYRRERGLDSTRIMKPLDEDDFAAYLSNGATREGWL